MRAKFGREFAGECVEGVQDEGISCGGGSEPFGEGGINEVDKEGVWEEGDVLIVRVCGGNMIGAAREGVRSAKVFSWDVGKAEIKLREVEEPVSLATFEFLGLAEVCEIFVVSEYMDRGWGSKEIVSPGVEGSYDCKEFSVIDIIVALSRAERLREIGTGVPVTVDVSLEEYSSRGML